MDGQTSECKTDVSPAWSDIKPEELVEKFKEFTRNRDFQEVLGKDFLSSPSSANSSVYNSRQELNDLTALNRNLVSEKDQLQADNDLLANRVDSLEELLETQHKKIDQIGANARATEMRLRNDVQSYQEDNQKLTQESDELKAANASLSLQVSKLKKTEKEATRTNEELSSLIDSLMNEKELTLEDNKKLKLNVRDLEEQCKAFLLDLNKKETEVEEAEKKLLKEQSFTEEYHTAVERLVIEKQHLEQQLQELECPDRSDLLEASGLFANAHTSYGLHTKDIFSEIQEAQSIAPAFQTHISEVKPMVTQSCQTDKVRLNSEGHTNDIEFYKFHEQVKDLQVKVEVSTQHCQTDEMKSKKDEEFLKSEKENLKLQEEIKKLQIENAENFARAQSISLENEIVCEHIAKLSDVNNKLISGEVMKWFDKMEQTFCSGDKVNESFDGLNFEIYEDSISTQIDALDLNGLGLSRKTLATGHGSSWMPKVWNDKVYPRSVYQRVKKLLYQDASNCEARIQKVEMLRDMIDHRITQRIQKNQALSEKNTDLLWKMITNLKQYSHVIGCLQSELKLSPVIKLLVRHIEDLESNVCHLETKLEKLSPGRNNQLALTSERLPSEEYMAMVEVSRSLQVVEVKNRHDSLLSAAISLLCLCSCVAVKKMGKFCFATVFLLVLCIATIEFPDYRVYPPVY